MALQIILRSDTAARWTSFNPKLAKGELGFEYDTFNLKIGDGLSNWNSLSYKLAGTVLSISSPPNSSQGNNGDYAIDYVHYMVYGPKSGGSWPSGASMIGSPGLNGTSFTWKGGWSIITAYSINDVVTWVGNTYICISPISAAFPDAIGSPYWALMASKGSSINGRGTWSSATAYAVNDMVRSSTSTYLCIVANTNQAVTNTSYWMLVTTDGSAGANGDWSTAQTINYQTTNYTMVAGDVGKLIMMDMASTGTVTVPTGLGWTQGQRTDILAVGLGQISVVQSGTTITSRLGLKLAGVGSFATLVKLIAASTYVMAGDLVA